MANQNIKENSFEAGVSGKSGTLNYASGYGTPAGGSISQDPNHFAASDVPSTGSIQPTPPDRTSPEKAMAGRKSSTGALISPAAMSDKQDSDKPLNPKNSYDNQVNQIFQKKNTPSTDEIMTGLQYELSNMVKKDKTIAKQMVLKNLKQDPQYYSRLKMLNIDDETMKVDESRKSTFEKTKGVLDQMISERKQRYAYMNENSELNNIFKDLWAKRHGYK